MRFFIVFVWAAFFQAACVKKSDSELDTSHLVDTPTGNLGSYRAGFFHYHELAEAPDYVCVYSAFAEKPGELKSGMSDLEIFRHFRDERNLAPIAEDFSYLFSGEHNIVLDKEVLLNLQKRTPAQQGEIKEALLGEVRPVHLGQLKQSLIMHASKHLVNALNIDLNLQQSPRWKRMVDQLNWSTWIVSGGGLFLGSVLMLLEVINPLAGAIIAGVSVVYLKHGDKVAARLQPKFAKTSLETESLQRRMRMSRVVDQQILTQFEAQATVEDGMIIIPYEGDISYEELTKVTRSRLMHAHFLQAMAKQEPAVAEVLAEEPLVRADLSCPKASELNPSERSAKIRTKAKQKSLSE